MQFNKTTFINFARKNRIYQYNEENPWTLKSGQISPHYVNWRSINKKQSLTEFVATQIVHLLPKIENDLGKSIHSIYGIPEGMDITALVVQLMWNNKSGVRSDYVYDNLCMGRGKSKTHGDPENKYFVSKPMGNTIVIEDVITTGNSLMAELDRLAEAQTHVMAVIALTDRFESDGDNDFGEILFSRYGLEYYPMTYINDLKTE